MVASNLTSCNTVILNLYMATSYLIFGSNKETRKETVVGLINKKTGLDNDLKKWKSHPDVEVIYVKKNKKSIGIDQIRSGIKYLNEKPFSLRSKFLIIPKAYLLTTQAKNALIKTLEEPPLYADIFLLTKTRDDLLQTVISRCRIINIKGESEYVLKEDFENDIFKILNMKIGERLDWAGEFSKEDPEIIIETLESWILNLRNDIIKGHYGSRNYSNIKEVTKIMKDLSNTNINKTLALKNLVLHLQ